MSKYAKRGPVKHIRVTWVVLLSLFLVAGVVAAANLIPAWFEYRAARVEYEGLRQYDPRPAPTKQAPDPQDDSRARIAELREINPDFVGWIHIDDTEVDYPVVLGTDNQYYLNRTFRGEINPSGSIFLDYRNTTGFTGNFAMVYGHAMRDGSMFAILRQYLNSEFQTTHPTIQVTGLDAVTTTYKVFAVRPTTVYDPAYGLVDSSPTAVMQYLVDAGLSPTASLLALSTCVSANPESSERLLILAARE